MLIEESKWINSIIRKYFSATNFPLLNIGSSTYHFRTQVQPHIHTQVFAPLMEQNYKVLHLDMKKEEGVDLVGDLTSNEFRKSLKDLNIRSVLCSNLLEHVKTPKLITNSIIDLLHSGDLILVTVPYSFPFHEDPIDTLFRPDAKALHQLFTNTEIIESEVVVSNGSYWNDLKANKKYLFIMLARLFMPFYKPQQWPSVLKDFLNAKKKYSATCLLLRKV